MEHNNNTIYTFPKLKKLLNQIADVNLLEDGADYMENLIITHGGPKNSITFFTILCYDEDASKFKLTIAYSNGGLIEPDKKFRDYKKRCPHSCKIFMDNTIPILKEIVNLGIDIDYVDTFIDGDVEFKILQHPISKKFELRGRHYWNKYGDYIEDEEY